MTSPGPYGQDIPSLSLSVWFETAQRLRVTLRDATRKRWEIPPSFLNIPSLSPPSMAPPTSLYDFSYTQNPFSFAISRKSSGQVLFNTSGQSLFFEDQFLQISTSMASDATLYGLGERIVPFKLPQEDFVIWNNG